MNLSLNKLLTPCSKPQASNFDISHNSVLAMSRILCGITGSSSILLIPRQSGSPKPLGPYTWKNALEYELSHHKFEITRTYVSNDF